MPVAHEPRAPGGAGRGARRSLAGTLAKIARDVVLLAQAEVGEVREGGEPDRGGSSAMAAQAQPGRRRVGDRRAPSACPASCATMLAAMPQEHERAAGALAGRVGDDHATCCG